MMVGYDTLLRDGVRTTSGLTATRPPYPMDGHVRELGRRAVARRRSPFLLRQGDLLSNTASADSGRHLLVSGSGTLVHSLNLNCTPRRVECRCAA